MVSQDDLRPAAAPPRGRAHRRLASCAAALLVLFPAGAEALMFQTATIAGRSILVVRDCGKQGFEDTNCTEDMKGFARGDSDRLRPRLGRAVDEVWLISLGGDLDEGIKVGEAFRESQATVRVPAGYRCVSSCTVAFMGGFFRIIDAGATYEVHAASGFLSGFDRGFTKGVLDRLTWEPQSEYARLAAQELDSARMWAVRLLYHFERSLVRPGTPVSNVARLDQWRRSAPASTYASSARAAEDSRRFRAEGVTSAQETLMRIERDSMAQAIDELRQLLPQLGPRADRALKMLDAMYSSRIVFTASLSRETLESMGYVTVFVQPGGAA